MPAGDVSITANYSQIDYTVTVDGLHGTEGGGGTYHYQDTVTLSTTQTQVVSLLAGQLMMEE